MSYTHLTREERYQIYALKRMGHTQGEIGEALGRSPATVSRELRRNRGTRGWRDILRRIAHEIFRDHVFLASSGIAFLAILALLPVISAIVSVYGLATSPQELHQQMQSLGSVIPDKIVNALSGNLRCFTSITTAAWETFTTPWASW